MKQLIITGIRGLPAAHGGFETFAENLALYLRDRGWDITVYCQEDSGDFRESKWEGINLIHIPVKSKGAFGTILFDFKSIVHSYKLKGLVLTLGYNTAVFNSLYFFSKRKNIINMDGIEWKRDKWGGAAKTWFWLNERFGCWFGSHLIADHPKIKEHLSTRINEKKITMIPYGAPRISNGDESVLSSFFVEKYKYFLVVARAEPENSILEIVQGFSAYHGEAKLLILGNYDFLNNDYHKKVKAIAGPNVLFPGAVYDKRTVSSLRYYCLAYIHGHQVGGTNPSLVEALGAGNPIIAHDNKFNRWVIGEQSIYFYDADTCGQMMNKISEDKKLKYSLSEMSMVNYEENFTWDKILFEYEKLLSEWLLR